MSCNDGGLPQCKGNSQSKNSKVFETKRLTQGTLFCALGKGLIFASPACFLIVSMKPLFENITHTAPCADPGLLRMANETVPILATTRQSHSNAMTSTVWLEMKV